MDINDDDDNDNDKINDDLLSNENDNFVGEEYNDEDIK